jgi:phosphate transport system substrate-binding protein
MRKIIIPCVLLILGLIACNGVNTPTQGYTQGTTTIIADETFAPVIEDQLLVFRDNYPKADIKVIYKPENELLNSFLNDSVDIAIMSRKLNDREKTIFENKKITIRVNRFAIDGVALIINESAADSIISVEDIINVMQGKKGKIKGLVFDNANSSTVRYLKELSQIQDLPSSGVYALKSNAEVIKFVYQNPGTIGVVGMNWLEQPDDKTEVYVSKLRVMGVKNLAGKPGSDKYYRPDQDNLALGLYPLTRDLFIINCTGGPGLGSGFATFLAGEKGQRIVLKSGLLPDKIPSRQLLIRNKL